MSIFVDDDFGLRETKSHKKVKKSLDTLSRDLKKACVGVRYKTTKIKTLDVQESYP